tara:strand:+ start:512 stop:709 length:198 start_codon:yes stop_codon:yes gene_type:complete
MFTIIIGTAVGMFMWNNAEFFNTAKQQREEGYEWVFKPKEHDTSVPAIPMTVDDKSKIIWKLETK